MAAKLKHLKIQKVDFVDEGANPDAHIKLFKRKEKEGQSKKEGKGVSVWKRLLAFIGKEAGIDQGEIDSAMEVIQKGDSISFNEKINEVNNRKVVDEIWDICYALQSSLCSILYDEELDSTKSLAAMQESLNEFCIVVQECMAKWSDGKQSNIIRKKEEESEIVEKNNKNLRGEEEMKIDKSKLTDAERAFLESIEKRCESIHAGEVAEEFNAASVAAQTQQQSTNVGSTDLLSKALTDLGIPVKTTGIEQEDDIYKGLNPIVRKELEALKKFREEAEEKELKAVAKKYEIIGKKEEELLPILKNLRAAGGTAYNDMIAVLDQAVDTVEKSGVFSEIGKAGEGVLEKGAWSEAETKAAELMKSKIGLTKAQAMDEVFQADPELAARCEKEE